jgi:ribose transport system permease protein
MKGLRTLLYRHVGILFVVLVLWGLVVRADPDAALSADNFQNLARRWSLLGILTLGAGILIVSGGIDLALGSSIGLAAVCLALLLQMLADPLHYPFLESGLLAVLWPWLAMLLVIGMTALEGVAHGLMVTRLRLQPFLVTLWGLFIYRGLAQWVTGGTAVGLGGVRRHLAWADWLFKGTLSGVPVILLVFFGLALLMAVFMHLSVYGRYLSAVGYNEQAARYAGVSVERYKVLAYVLCSALAGLGGVIFLFEFETATPTNTGLGFELYAITGAVLGGCSLRGGEGTVLGMVLGAAVLPLLENLCNLNNLNELQNAVIGVALMVGTVTNEVLRRRTAARV